MTLCRTEQDLNNLRYWDGAIDFYYGSLRYVHGTPEYNQGFDDCIKMLEETNPIEYTIRKYGRSMDNLAVAILKLEKQIAELNTVIKKAL